MGEKRQFCTFYLGDSYFGIDVLDVQEIIRFQDMARVPLAPTVIKGLINLRGQIVTAIDMRGRLNMPDRDPEASPINLIINMDNDSTVSLLVDEIGDVMEVDSDWFERPPETLGKVARKLIEGAYKLEDRLLLVLDTTKTLSLNSGTNGSGCEEAREVAV